MVKNPVKVTETDPTVPQWAKEPTKPTYTASEVGALPSSTKIPTKLPNPNALTFTGAVTGTYDGSQPLTIDIPQGGSGAVCKPRLIADLKPDGSVSEIVQTVEELTYPGMYSISIEAKGINNPNGSDYVFTWFACKARESGDLIRGIQLASSDLAIRFVSMLIWIEEKGQMWHVAKSGNLDASQNNWKVFDEKNNTVEIKSSYFLVETKLFLLV